MQRQTIEDFIESKRVWEEREKERQRLEEARIEDFLSKKEAWRQGQTAIEVDKRQRKSQVVMEMGEARALERAREKEKERLRLEFHEGRLREMEREVEQTEVAQEIRRRIQLREAHQVLHFFGFNPVKLWEHKHLILAGFLPKVHKLFLAVSVLLNKDEQILAFRFFKAFIKLGRLTGSILASHPAVLGSIPRVSEFLGKHVDVAEVNQWRWLGGKWTMA